jgi:hypothetical protein
MLLMITSGLLLPAMNTLSLFCTKEIAAILIFFLKSCDGLDLVFLGNHDMDKVPEERTICPGVWKTNKSIIIVVEGGKGASCIYYCCAQTTYSFKPCFFPSMLCSLISSSPDRWLAFSMSRLSTRMIGISQPPSGCASAVTQSRQAKKTCSTMSSGPAP